MPTLLSATPRINELDARLARAGVRRPSRACWRRVPSAWCRRLPGTRPQLNRVIAAGSRGVAGGHHRLQRLLVVGQVALSVLLVGSATLLLRSYYNLTQVDTGFDTSSTVTFHVGAAWDEDRWQVGQLQEQLIARLEQLPHVQAVGLTNFLPATGATLRYQVYVDGLTGPNTDGSMTVGTRMISGGYLRAIRAPLVAGEWCPAAEDGLQGAGHGDGEPALRRGPCTESEPRRTIDMDAPADRHPIPNRRRRRQPRRGRPRARVRCLTSTRATPPGTGPIPSTSRGRRTRGAFATDLRRMVRELDPKRAVFGLRPVQAVLDAALDQPRLDAAMLGLFAAAAVTLAAIGLYSLFMLMVTERAREMAVRLAIGAAPRQMIQLVMAGAGRLLAGGIVAGIVLTAAADRVLRGVLFGVSPLDARALAAAALTLAIVAAIAVAGPALKAARIAPIDALKGE